MTNIEKLNENNLRATENIGKVSLEVVNIARSTTPLPHKSEYDINGLSSTEVVSFMRYIDFIVGECLPKQCVCAVEIKESDIKGKTVLVTIKSSPDSESPLLN